MIVIWAVGFVVGLVVAASASRRAVTAALTASEASNISPALIGITVLAVGTDLPEIANSIVAALSGHGDLIIGDTVGSAFTQVTLVLGLLCLAGRPLVTDHAVVLLTGGMATGALLVVALMVRDLSLSRWEGLALIIGWIVAVAIVHRRTGTYRATRRSSMANGAARHGAVALAWLAVVGVSATVVVESFVGLTDRIGLPELLTSALVLSLGTSLPELVVDWTAVRRGATALAIGDLFGSTLLDATLAPGIGPALRAVEVSPTATTVTVIAALAVVAATAIAASKPVHDRRTSPLMFLVYGAAVAAVLVTVA